MKTQPIKPIPTFKGNDAYTLKKLFKSGKLPIKYGIYGGRLTKENASKEHLIPRSLGGKDTFENVALATKENNSKRGNDDITNYLTEDSLTQYLVQFIDLNVGDFKGIDHIKAVLKTLNSYFDEVSKFFNIK